MFGCVTHFQHSKHTRIPGELDGFVRRLGRRARRTLGVVRYEKLGVYCIVDYLESDGGVFVDVMNLGHSLANFGRKARIEFEQRLFRPLRSDETCRVVAEAESDYFHGRQDDNEEEKERLEKCARGE
jgi:hypothetical protein